MESSFLTQFKDMVSVGSNSAQLIRKSFSLKSFPLHSSYRHIDWDLVALFSLGIAYIHIHVHQGYICMWKEGVKI